MIDNFFQTYKTNDLLDRFNYCESISDSAFSMELFSIESIVNDIVNHIKENFSDIFVKSSFDKDMEIYFITIDNDELYFSEEYLSFVNKYIEEINQEYMGKIVFSCDPDMTQSYRNMMITEEAFNESNHLDYSSVEKNYSFLNITYSFDETSNQKVAA